MEPFGMAPRYPEQARDRVFGDVDQAGGGSHPTSLAQMMDDGRCLFLSEAVMAPDGVRRGLMVFGQVLGPFSGADNIKPSGPRPINHLSDKRRLVAVAHRIDNACLGCASSQEWTRKHVGFDIDHHDVLAVFTG